MKKCKVTEGHIKKHSTEGSIDIIGELYLIIYQLFNDA